MCPQTADSWCKFQADVINNTKLYKKSKSLLPKAVKKAIKQIFMELSDTDLLGKCLHAKTQNNNGCLNGMLWKKRPKDIFVGKGVLEMGVSSAVICFNDGRKGILDVTTNCCLKPGKFIEIFIMQEDNERMRIMGNKAKQFHGCLKAKIFGN